MSELLALAAELQRRGESFALATVVRCEAPTSAKPGAKALVREDGTVSGWVGGACAEPVVVREALHALADGRPRLIGLLGEGARGPGRTSGMIEYPMTCHSGGTLEIYVEPYLAKPLLVLVGHGPVIDALATFGHATEYSVQRLRAEEAAAMLTGASAAHRAAVVVATHADSDEDALDRLLRTEAGYVSLVASRRRAAVMTLRLQQRGVPLERLARLKAPAGLDIGAESPDEIAVSILAEIIQHRRTAKPEPPAESTATEAEAIDPVCGMTVEIAGAAYRSELSGRIVYFCCAGCKTSFDREPAKYRRDSRGARFTRQSLSTFGDSQRIAFLPASGTSRYRRSCPHFYEPPAPRRRSRSADRLVIAQRPPRYTARLRRVSRLTARPDGPAIL